MPSSVVAPARRGKPEPAGGPLERPVAQENAAIRATIADWRRQWDMYTTIWDHVVFAARCPACNIVAVGLCHHCRAELRVWEPSGCLRCGAGEGSGCLCDALPDQVVSVSSLWEMAGPVADLVEATKSGDLWRIGAVRREVCTWLPGSAPGARGARIVSVPPRRAALRRRGFDLPAILAGWAARAGGVARARRALRRTHEGDGDAGQTGASRSSRLRGAHGQFVCKRAPRSVVLVDDVITTGATIMAATLALAEGGAEEIRVVSVARTPRYRGEGGE